MYILISKYYNEIKPILDFRKYDDFQKLTWAYALLKAKVKSFELNKAFQRFCTLFKVWAARKYSHSAAHLPTISLRPALQSPSQICQNNTHDSWIEIFLNLSNEAARGRHSSDCCNGLLWYSTSRVYPLTVNSLRKYFSIWNQNQTVNTWPFFRFVNQRDSKQINLQTQTNISTNTVNSMGFFYFWLWVI